MATYALDITKNALGLVTYVSDWRIALFYSGTDPLTDIVAAEVEDSRIVLPGMQESATVGYMENAAIFSIGPLVSGIIGGWFLVNGPTETDVAWVGTFASPLTLSTGDYVKFGAGTVLVRIA